jgi:NDP-sugar pyrophosphorylase family protein/aminoglycoside/choline kinase family phosphotransferase
MKAMILAAGLGTRLLPLTEKMPKPLFPVLGRPLIDILIRRLEDMGCTAVIINTHHLAPMIETFLKTQHYNIPVLTRYERTILGTGGGIKNVEDFWNDDPFLVVNGDIFTDIDLQRVYRFHTSHADPVTLAVHDDPRYNHVWIDAGDRVRGFGIHEPCPPPNTGSEEAANGAFRKLAYTGIQVLDPAVLSFIPQGAFCSIIDVFCKMIQAGKPIRGFVVRDHQWHDIGTMAGYREALRETLARRTFATAFPVQWPSQIQWSKLKGDGSDRQWYRVSIEGGQGSGVGGQGQEFSIIIVDHGPREREGVTEADAFAAIGHHLRERGIPVPRIWAYDRSSGLAALEDLGDMHLQRLVKQTADPNDVLTHYRAVIDRLIFLAVEGAKGFDLRNTYQTTHYDRALILDREARYFVEAFLNGYLGMPTAFESLKDDFILLAEGALSHPYHGLLHRDFQSRNILVKNSDYYVIDFQGARLGPLQYDLASLLIDPYVALSESVQEVLLNDYVEKLSGLMPVDHDAFLKAYPYCALNRNLQILGAFAFLSREKGKKDFEAYIPVALSSLKTRLEKIERGVCPKLRAVVKSL